MVLIPDSFLNSIRTRGKKIDKRIDEYLLDSKIELPQLFLSKMKLLKNSPLGSFYQKPIWKLLTATVYSVSNQVAWTESSSRQISSLSIHLCVILRAPVEKGRCCLTSIFRSYLAAARFLSAVPGVIIIIVIKTHTQNPWTVRAFYTVLFTGWGP